ncbi:MAG: primosomal protein N', partial [Treponema sp.]|nr:primosomal protein N' [Treponema sp.]
MKYLQVAVNIPLNQTFTYLSTDTEDVSRTGYRVEVKFGNRRMTGVVTGESNSLPEDFPVELNRLRPITRFLDDEPLLTPDLISLGKWVSKYYICAIGEAVCSMLPGGKRESDTPGFSFEDEISSEAAVQLSEEQKAAVEGILSEDSTKLHYLYGPTGTGKTEVFLQAASRLLEQGKGVIYLVPEIGLTQQVIEAVVKRFGNTVAVLHSALTPSQKLAEWKRILHGQARVVIGARSAVFAPVPDLGLIIIDEEHDGSYKSGSTPRYHARQLAMYRCSKLDIPLVMGSATPSVEAWHMMQTGVISRHTLTRRLAGGAMPEIRTIDLSLFSNGSSISPELENEINLTLKEKKQTILFL